MASASLIPGYRSKLGELHFPLIADLALDDCRKEQALEKVLPCSRDIQVANNFSTLDEDFPPIGRRLQRSLWRLWLDTCISTSRHTGWAPMAWHCLVPDPQAITRLTGRYMDSTQKQTQQTGWFTYQTLFNLGGITGTWDWSESLRYWNHCRLRESGVSGSWRVTDRRWIVVMWMLRGKQGSRDGGRESVQQRVVGSVIQMWVEYRVFPAETQQNHRCVCSEQPTESELNKDPYCCFRG